MGGGGVRRGRPAPQSRLLPHEWPGSSRRRRRAAAEYNGPAGEMDLSPGGWVQSRRLESIGASPSGSILRTVGISAHPPPKWAPRGIFARFYEVNQPRCPPLIVVRPLGTDARRQPIWASPPSEIAAHRPQKARARASGHNGVDAQAAWSYMLPGFAHRGAYGARPSGIS